MLNNTKTRAYLVDDGRPVAVTMTAARNGDIMAYGFTLLDGCILQVGWAKVSRDVKWRRYDAECSVFGKLLEYAHVNHGGGVPI